MPQKWVCACPFVSLSDCAKWGKSENAERPTVAFTEIYIIALSSKKHDFIAGVLAFNITAAKLGPGG